MIALIKINITFRLRKYLQVVVAMYTIVIGSYCHTLFLLILHVSTDAISSYQLVLLFF
jgi:hypothetical protein